MLGIQLTIQAACCTKFHSHCSLYMAGFKSKVIDHSFRYMALVIETCISHKQCQLWKLGGVTGGSKTVVSWNTI